MMVRKRLSRRAFLKISSMGLAGLFLPDFMLPQHEPDRPEIKRDWLLGRVLKPDSPLYQHETTESELLAALDFDSVYRITDIIVGGEVSAANKVWYQLDRLGYTHSSNIQPVRMRTNQPARMITENGCVGEVTYPYVDAYSSVAAGQEVVYRLYFAGTIWVVDSVVDVDGHVWYEFLDDYYHRRYFVPADCIRLIPEPELSGLLPEVPFDDKQLVVDLEKQLLTAYVQEKVVARMRVSSSNISSEGGLPTPRGTYRTIAKRPTRRMYTPPSDFGSGFDLPGVPWVCYFTVDGIALHGAYWHNNFGMANSHGCITLRPRDAKWIYRWTTPTVPPGKYYYADNQATKIIIT